MQKITSTCTICCMGTDTKYKIVSNLNYCNATFFYKKLQFLLQDVSNNPDAIIEKLSNEQIKLNDKMHLMCLSSKMLITEP